MVWATRWLKNFESVITRFDRIHERDKGTHGHRMTAYTTPA